jgi:hypothetical protein
MFPAGTVGTQTAGAVTVWVASTVSVVSNTSISVVTMKDVANVVWVTGIAVRAVEVDVARTTTTDGVKVVVVVEDLMLRHLHCSVSWEA